MKIRRVLALCGAGVLFAAAVPTLAGAAESFKDVVIRNTALEPVPITPVAPVPVTGTLGATQSGSWNVGVSGTVDVGNTVRTIGAVPGERFVATARLDNRDCGNCDFEQLVVVPAGKIAVVESVSTVFEVTPGQVPEVYVSATTSTAEVARLFLAMVQQGEVGTGIDLPGLPYQVLAGTHAVKLFVPAEATFTAAWFSRLARTGDTVQGTVTVNGYYLPSS